MILARPSPAISRLKLTCTGRMSGLFSSEVPAGAGAARAAYHLKDEKELGQGRGLPGDFRAAEAVEPSNGMWWSRKTTIIPIESVRLDFEQLRRWGRV